MEAGEIAYLGLVAKSESDVAAKDPFKDQHVDSAMCWLRSASMVSATENGLGRTRRRHRRDK
jgi:hypothetical protein